MNGKCLVLFTVFASLCASCNAAASSYSCVWINGKEVCKSSTNENGNFAGAAGVASGSGGSVAAGTGNPDGTYNVNRGQLIPGNGGNNEGAVAYPNYQTDYDGNYGGGAAYPNYQSDYYGNGGAYPNYQPMPNYGRGGMAVATAGQFNPAMNPNGFDPFAYVDEMMRRMNQGKR